MRTAVVIPCKDQAHFLDDAIDSLFKQLGGHPHEIIVVDDASDNPQSVSAVVSANNAFILDTNFHEPIELVRIEARSVWEARKAGFERTTADVICFLDADDKLPSDYFVKGLEQFERFGPRFGIVYSDMQEFGDGDKYHRYADTGMVNKELIQRHNQYHSGSLVSRRAVEMSGAFNAPRPANWTADWYLWKQIMEAGFRSAKSSAVFQYRKHPASMTSNWGPTNHYEDGNLALETVAIVNPDLVWLHDQTWKRWSVIWIVGDKNQSAKVSREAFHPFVFFPSSDPLPPLDVIETLMRQMVPQANWITHESGSVLVRRSALFDYAILKYNEAKGVSQTP